MSEIEKVLTQEEIELRAYEIYLKRGGKTEMLLTTGLPLRRNCPNQDRQNPVHR
jgi:hypothetical protein